MTAASNSPDDVLLELLHEDAAPPARATEGSAGYDLRAYLRHRTIRHSNGVTTGERTASDAGDQWSVTLAPGEMALIPLGFRTRMPSGIEAQIRPRSGQVFKQALTVANAPGTIDSDYAEEWMVIVRNDAPVVREIVHGERIAQAVFARHEAPLLRQSLVTRTTDRAGGFGSTGRV